MSSENTYQWAEKTVPITEGSSETTTKRYMENYKNFSQDIRDQLNAKAESVQIILTGIDNDIYSTIDACPNACEMWKAVERCMNDLSEISVICECQFLLQLQPEWQRFVTLVKQSQELKTVSYHKLYDILKQHHNEVNEIRAERLARTAIAAGSKDRPPMLAPGNYVQWKSRIKRYIDTKPNSELIHYCLQNPPYTYQWAEKTVPVAEGSSETTTKRYMENYKNFSQDIRDQLNAKAESVQIILTGIDNDIYSTVDACHKTYAIN
ncbi:retrovirus-related pol polyprotein from transposon TNT 1-94 [Tanacetum coccineum]